MPDRVRDAVQRDLAGDALLRDELILQLLAPEFRAVILRKIRDITHVVDVAVLFGTRDGVLHFRLVIAFLIQPLPHFLFASNAETGGFFSAPFLSLSPPFGVAFFSSAIVTSHHEKAV